MSNNPIEFSNTPVPRGIDIRRVRCISVGDGKVEAVEEIRSSYNTSLVKSTRSVSVESPFTYEALRPIVWQQENGFRAWPQ
jgi:hypothetical protein